MCIRPLEEKKEKQHFYSTWDAMGMVTQEILKGK
jgi:hypothetical protein